MIQSAFGFTKMTTLEFEEWIQSVNIGRVVSSIQLHHTWKPNYSSFDGSNHFDLQWAMRRYHVQNNGWDDIGQHFTVFPDGNILTGRDLENDPAGIFGFNRNSICIENLGNFDIGADEMSPLQRDALIRLTASLCRKFSISVSDEKIVYHHWFDTHTGKRDDGVGERNKSCPGSNFFGGNTVEDFRQNFLPLVSQIFNDL